MRRRITGGFTLIELMIVVAVIGVLAAIAIPNFMKYIRKSKTSEAREQLSKMYAQARVYYLETYGAREAGGIVLHQFPGTIPLTPAVTCCRGQGINRCPPEPSQWTAPTWVALHFSINDPHYYRYEFISSGTGVDARFTARARGDLDCDGIESTFEMYGAVTSDSGDITGTSGVVRVRELE